MADGSFGVVSFIERIVEERVKEGRKRGLFDNNPFEGKPIPDIDEHRPDGWWAEAFVKRERKRVAEEAEAARRESPGRDQA